MKTTNENELKLPTPPPGFHIATEAERKCLPEGSLFHHLSQPKTGWRVSGEVGNDVSDEPEFLWCCHDTPTEELVKAIGTEALVCQDIATRQAHGLSKYGVSVAENPLTVDQWLTHLYQELLDGAVYAKRAIGMVQTLAKEITRLRAEVEKERARAELAESRLEDCRKQVELTPQQKLIAIRKLLDE